MRSTLLWNITLGRVVNVTARTFPFRIYVTFAEFIFYSDSLTLEDQTDTFVPKRRQTITTRHCVISQKSADFYQLHRGSPKSRLLTIILAPNNTHPGS